MRTECTVMLPLVFMPLFHQITIPTVNTSAVAYVTATVVTASVTTVAVTYATALVFTVGMVIWWNSGIKTRGNMTVHSVRICKFSSSAVVRRPVAHLVAHTDRLPRGDR